MLLFGPFDEKPLIANGLDIDNVVMGGLLPSDGISSPFTDGG